MPPQPADDLLKLATSHHLAGRLHDAELIYRRILSQDPRQAPALHGLGAIALQVGQADVAIDLLHQTIAIDPKLATAHNNLGNALREVGQIDAAITAFREAIAVNPNFVAAHSNLVFSMQFHPGYGTPEIAAEVRWWNERHAAPLARTIMPYLNDGDPERRLRIGYVSPDFRDHAVGRNLLPLFQHHERQQFEIFSFSHTAYADAMTGEFKKGSDHWRDISGQTDEQAAKQIRDDRIDILIDLALHSANNRLRIFARKPAPVQATLGGYPGSTGLTTVDYRLSDPYLDPATRNDATYSEKTIRLPDAFWCYDPLDCRDIPSNDLPALRNGFITFGCLNNPCKINDATLALWANVLQRVQKSRLLMLAEAGSLRTHVVKFFGSEGITADRIEFLPRLPRRDYLKQYHRIDIGVDTFPYNGHTTSLDSFWMGVPVITLVGETAVSRAGLCQLSNLGLANLAASTSQECAEIAVALAGDLKMLQPLRSSLRSRMEASPLMNAAKFAREIESAYRQMWRHWCPR